MMTEKQPVFSDIYKEYYQKILHFLTRLVGDQEGEGVTLVVFEKISRSLGSFWQRGCC